MIGCDLLDENRLVTREVRDRLARNRLRQKSDEIAGMAGLECDANFAVGLEPANARTMPGTWVNDNERPQLRIYFDSRWRDNAHEQIIHRPLERAPINHQLGFVVEHIRYRLGYVLAVLVPALTQYMP